MNKNRLLFNYFSYMQFGGDKKKWDTLEHNGVMFPPEYVKHDIPVIYNGEEIFLEAQAEEYITIYAKYLDSEYIKSKTFNKNFWHDWKKMLGKNHKIESLDKCDLTRIRNNIIEKKINKQKPSQEEKKETDEKEKKYKTAIVDNKIQPVGNFRMEPPGIFIGRGCNPKLGMLKARIQPEDIIINIGKEAKIPDPGENHKWKKVIHDKTVEWLASWRDDITGKTKYMWLGAHSEMKNRNDMEKFDLARKLKKKIKFIREENNKNLMSQDLYTKQIATALYFIDNFALRVGNEKAEDETDTVGVTSLRVEHIELLDNNYVKLDFLGKDSVRYNRTLTVDKNAYSNLKEFMQDKKKDDSLFDQISSNDINKYLQSFMKNLTAKVFRTFNASNLFYKELKKTTKKYETYEMNDKINLLLDEFNRANAKVAMLCNHQKNITKSSNNQIEKISQSIKKLKEQIKLSKDTKKDALNEKLKKMNAKKILKIELKNISLGTSKVNYIDPRITASFLLKNKIPTDKVFTKTLREKFKWAFEDQDIENFKF